MYTGNNLETMGRIQKLLQRALAHENLLEKGHFLLENKKSSVWYVHESFIFRKNNASFSIIYLNFCVSDESKNFIIGCTSLLHITVPSILSLKQVISK